MKKTIVLVLASILVMVFAAAAPVMSSQPKTTYTFDAIGITIDPGNVFTSADKIAHARSQQSSIKNNKGHKFN